MPISLPNETNDYRNARTKLLEAERALRQQTEEVAQLRRQLPLGGKLATDYVFTNTANQSVKLSGLFGGHDTLAIYSLMYGVDATRPCPMCSAFLDGMTGQIKHIRNRIGFAVAAQNTSENLRTLQDEMEWGALPLYSALNSTYQHDYLAQSDDGDQLPILNIFVRNGDDIHHFWASELFFQPSDWHPRHIDPLWSLWNLLDLTPEGRGDFMPASG